MYTPEAVARIDQLRAISLTRKLTPEEQKEALSIIRADRVGAHYASSGAKAKTAAKAPADGASILAAMMQAVGGGTPNA